jgi:hypothetical protein
MADTNNEAREQGRTERFFAGGLIIVFLLAIVAMFLLRNNTNWDRLLVLFGALQALCFAGAGTLFGTNIQNRNVVQARQDAAEARTTAESATKDAAAKQAEAERERGTARVQAERGMNLADALRAAMAAALLSQVQTDRPGARPDDFSSEVTPVGLASVVDLADRLFPPGSRQ